MKKLLLLVAGLFLFGCGVGGTGTPSNTGTHAGGDTGGGATTAGNGGSPAGASVGYLTLAFPEETTTAKAVAAEVVPDPVPVPGKVRYVISVFKPAIYDEDGNVVTEAVTTLENRGDIIPGTPANIALAVGTYRVDMVSYKEGTPNEILKYYSQTFAIQQSKTTSVTIVMQRKKAFAAPLSVNQATTYDLVAPIYPFSTTDFWILRSTDTQFTDVGTDFSSIVNANIRFTAGNYSQPPAHKDYFQGKFTLDPIFLVTGETASSWQYIYPNPVYLEAQVVTTVETPGGFVIDGDFK